MQNLKSENIVQLFYVLDEQDAIYLVMEFCSEGNLQ